MPSELAMALLGEAKPPKPSSIFQKAYPSAGSEPGIIWRVHRNVGVAAPNADEAEYEEWLQNFMVQACDFDSEGCMASNQISVANLEKVAELSSGIRWADDFVRLALRVARQVGADTVTFTTPDGVDG